MRLTGILETLRKSIRTVTIVLLSAGALVQPLHGQSPAAYALDLPRADFDVRDTAERDAGRHLVDVEVRDTENGPLFSGRVFSRIYG